MRRTKIKKSYLSMLGFVLLLIVSIGSAVYLYRNMDNLKDGAVSGFHVEYDGKAIKDKAANIFLLPDEENRFDIKYTFGFLDKGSKGYNVKIVPNTDFEFSVDGMLYAYSAEPDLTTAFDIKLHEDYFTIELPKDMTVRNILESIYSDKTLKLPDSLPDEDYVSLIISSLDGKDSVSIDIRISGVSFEMFVDTPKVVF